MGNSIKKHIDKDILLILRDFKYSDVREYLYERSNKFRNDISSDYDLSITLSESQILNVRDNNLRYHLFFIYFLEKRILDINKIERDFNFGFSPMKNFKLLLFKESLMEPKRIELHQSHFESLMGLS